MTKQVPIQGLVGKHADAAMAVDGSPKELPGKARLYVTIDIDDRLRFAGAERGETYLRECVMECWPGSEAFIQARPAGPAKAYRSADTWTDRPFTDGVVLVGDAAGYSDPIIGQGLSVASRDTRLVTEALLSTEHWAPDIFEEYAAERSERMRRLRVTSQTYAAAIAGLGAGRDIERRREIRQDRRVMMALSAAFVGPDRVPETMFHEDEHRALTSV